MSDVLKTLQDLTTDASVEKHVTPHERNILQLWTPSKGGGDEWLKISHNSSAQIDHAGAFHWMGALVRESAQVYWHRLRKLIQGDVVEGPDGKFFRFIAEQRKAFLVWLKDAGQNFDAAAKLQWGTHPVLKLGPSVGLLEGMHPNTAQVRLGFKSLLSIDEVENKIPKFRFDAASDRRHNPVEFRMKAEPELTRIARTMTEIYGMKLHEGQLPVKWLPPSTDNSYLGLAHVDGWMDAEMGADGKYRINHQSTTLCNRLSLSDADWGKTAMPYIVGHELGHALVGFMAAPQHYGVQEAIAEINRRLVTLAHPERFNRISEYEMPAIQCEMPEILAGEQGWGVPEFASLHIESAGTIGAQYAACTAAFLYALGGDIQKAIPLLRHALTQWKKKVTDKERTYNKYRIPRLEDWLQEMDTVIPGFRERFNERGMYQENSLIPEGERITWIPREFGGEFNVCLCTRNKNYLAPMRQGMKPMQNAGLSLAPTDTASDMLMLDGTEAILPVPPGDGVQQGVMPAADEMEFSLSAVHGPAPKQKGELRTEEIQTIFATLAPVKGIVQVKFDDGQRGAKTDFNGGFRFKPDFVHKCADFLNVPLRAGMKIHVTVKGEKHTARKTLIWEDWGMRGGRWK
ncbi:hypothetical protein HZA45_03195 [Candidatus Peregrinibacteria bacterium]|nr:hypothetical protein [Candidatus Peregrinibacteria bacterium]